MVKKHQIVLVFKQGNKKTAISCECGEECGVVATGTGIPEILKIYRKHIEEA